MPINHLAPVSIRRTTPYRHQSSRVTFQFQIYTSSSILWIISQIFFFLSILFRYSFSFFLSHYVNKIPLENYFTQFSSILFSSSLDALTILLSIIFHLNVSIFLNYLTILSFLPPFSLDSKRYFSWYFVSTFNEESSPHESYLEGKKFYHPLSDTLLLRFPFADEGNVYALVQHLLPNLRTFFSPRWWPTKTIHVRHAFFHQRCFTLSICIYIYFLWSNENYRIFIYKSPSFLHFITFLLSHLHFFPFFV